MATRHLYIARHGEADAFGELTDTGRRQAGLLGERLADIPIDTVWHSPLPRATDTALELVRRLSVNPPVTEVAELIDHIPYVPDLADTPRPWVPFFDGYDTADASSGHNTAQSLIARFAAAPDLTAPDTDTHEVLITHAYPIAWLLRDVFDASPVRWLGHNSANTALTIIEYRPGLPPSLVMFNDMSHLPAKLRWTGFPNSSRP